jgi:hypothetical protein
MSTLNFHSSGYASLIGGMWAVQEAAVHLGHFVIQRVGICRLRQGDHMGAKLMWIGCRFKFSFFKEKNERIFTLAECILKDTAQG